MTTTLDHDSTGRHFPVGDISRTVDVDGVTVRYTDNPGPADSGRLPTVLIHGTGGRTETHFGFIEPMLATRGRVIALDFSEPTGDVTVDALVRQVAAVIDDAAPDLPVSVLGYSLGAVIAASVAARRADTVNNLVLVAGWARTDAQQRLRNDVWIGLAEKAPELLGPYSTFCAFGAPGLHARTDEEIAAMHITDPPSAFLRKQMQLNREVDIVDDLAAITARTLVVGLTFDQMVPAHHSKELFGAIDDARYAELPTGHAVVFERPAQLFALIDEFTEHPDRHPAGSIVVPPRP